MLLLSLNYFGIITASLGMPIFIPQIIKSLGVTSNMTVGWLTMIPYVAGTISLIARGDLRPDERAPVKPVLGVRSLHGPTGDRRARRWAPGGRWPACLSRPRVLWHEGPVWAMPPMFLTGPAAARLAIA